MELFSKYENVHFNIFNEILNEETALTEEQIKRVIEFYDIGELDYVISEKYYGGVKTPGVFFDAQDGKMHPKLHHVPVRLLRSEAEAFYQLINLPITKAFLSESTYQKLKNAVEGMKPSWRIDDVEIKNRMAAKDNYDRLSGVLNTILTAIVEQRAICCDHIRLGVFSHTNLIVYPVKVEYSTYLNQFQLICYPPQQDRFIKMNLRNMSNVRAEGKHDKNIEEMHKRFVGSKKQKVTLQVNDIDYIDDRCFRMFSFYERDAYVDQESGKYLLTIYYYDFDRRELIRDILSLGPHAMVTEPSDMREEILEHIKAAVNGGTHDNIQ